jgi:hypothetical protein
MFKPIISIKGRHNYTYKFTHTAYILNVPVEFQTDLRYKDFVNLCEKGWSWEKITHFEETGELL